MLKESLEEINVWKTWWIHSNTGPGDYHIKQQYRPQFQIMWHMCFFIIVCRNWLKCEFKIKTSTYLLTLKTKSIIHCLGQPFFKGPYISFEVNVKTHGALWTNPGGPGFVKKRITRWPRWCARPLMTFWWCMISTFWPRHHQRLGRPLISWAFIDVFTFYSFLGSTKIFQFTYIFGKTCKH